MITPDIIVRHLQQYLPLFTGVFSESLTITAAQAFGLAVTVTAPDHGLSVGRPIIVTAGGVRNAIVDAWSISETVTRLVLAQEHDLIKPSQSGDPQTVTLGGIGAPWDGDRQIVGVASRLEIDIANPTGETAAPVLQAGAHVLEYRAAGLQGIWSVASVVDNDSFTFEVSGVPSLPTGQVDGLEIVDGVRVAAAADIDRAEAFYTKQGQGKAWLFLIMTDVDASKDRHSQSDAKAANTPGTLGRMTMLQHFATSLFLPTTKQSSGADAQVQAYGEIFRALVAALHCFRPEASTQALPYRATTNGHGPGKYNTAYYMHVYDWEIPSVLTFEDGFTRAKTVAFRGLDADFRLRGDPRAILRLPITIEETPNA